MVDDGYSYSYDRAGRFFLGVQRFGVSGVKGATYAVAEVIDCGVVAPPAGAAPPGAVDCVRAMCRVGPRVGRWIVLFTRETAPQVAAGWTRGPRRCVVSTPQIPLRAVDVAAQEHLRRTVGAAVPVVEPAQLTLVAFPTIISTVDPGPVQFQITVPLPGTVAVAPAFGWSFTDPDGTVSAASGPGRAFDGTAPGVAGYYLTHAFAEAGVGTVTVTETWTGTVTVQDLPPVALDPLVLTRTVQLLVKENRPVLVGN